MTLNKNFYKEIYDKEKMWMYMIDSNLMNVYYLTELKKFYLEKKQHLKDEVLIDNGLIKKIDNIILKLDYIQKEDEMGYIINLIQLKDLFLINRLDNNISTFKTSKLEKVEQNKRFLYDLRNKVTSEGNEDYIDDDFYYDEQKVA